MEITLDGIVTLLVLAFFGMAAFVAMLWFPLKVLGIRLNEVLDDITQPEAIFFGLYAVACANVVGSLFSRFI
jgi:Na+-transporting NADH:ubiquinone oxidoreductase subunit NqrE